MVENDDRSAALLKHAAGYLRVVDAYKNLGSLTDASKTRNRELAARRAAGDCATKALGPKIMSKKALRRYTFRV